MTHLKVENAWVEFPISLRGSQKALASPTGGTIDLQRGVVAALRDISFELHEGDRLGLMGHNGAGKSTLLRLLSGAYAPTRGRVISTGTISTLFSTMPGLSRDGTGRENIMNCGLQLGMPRKQVLAKMDEIIDFAGLGEFIDLPVRIYSAGMTTRLGFSIATAVEPEILLLDEGLGTGDASFALKAQAKMNELIHRSSILVIASHSEALLAKMCTHCIQLDHGQVIAEGTAKELFDEYVRAAVVGARANDPGGLEAAYKLATEMVKQGKKPEPELEEQGLRYALQRSPDDAGMLQRYVQLLAAQGKPVSGDLEARMLTAVSLRHPDRDDLVRRLGTVLKDKAEEITPEVRDKAMAITAETAAH